MTTIISLKDLVKTLAECGIRKAIIREKNCMVIFLIVPRNNKEKTEIFRRRIPININLTVEESDVLHGSWLFWRHEYQLIKDTRYEKGSYKVDQHCKLLKKQ